MYSTTMERGIDVMLDEPFNFHATKENISRTLAVTILDPNERKFQCCYKFTV